MGQQERVLRFMEDNGSISSYEAFRELGVTRLSAVVFDLKRKGYPITSEKECARNRYNEPVYFSRYRLQGGGK